MASYKEEEDPFEEIVFDQARLLNTTPKLNTAIRRVSSGKCVLFAKTLGICGVFFGLGLCIAIPGPTFLLPISELQVDVSLMTNIYVARSSGYAVGSIIGGILFDRFNRLFLLFVSLLLTSVFITVIPWCIVLWLLKACMVGLGMSMGFLDTGELACPALIRHLMVNDPKVLMRAALFLNTLCIVIFATLWWLSSQLGEKYCAITSDGYQLANQHDEEEDMMDINLTGNACLASPHPSRASCGQLANYPFAHNNCAAKYIERGWEVSLQNRYN
uniref:(California timema) hypothetical protein n=1 Tax=Timema californicum TaxID=61474 RepID=A0A7R9P8H9_TIMCA|nr:unnamed protein product [Timema californicum]